MNQSNLIQALWLSGYSDRLEIYFLRERRFESCRRRLLFAFEDDPFWTSECVGKRKASHWVFFDGIVMESSAEVESLWW
jgi:hypothetical protein